jgi:hypothetical protein
LNRKVTFFIILLTIVISGSALCQPKMFFIERTGWDNTRLVVCNPDGTNWFPICGNKLYGEKGYVEAATFSPSNKEIYFIYFVNSRQKYLYSSTLDGKKLKKIANCWEIEAGNSPQKIKGLTISYASLQKMLVVGSRIENKVSPDGCWMAEQWTDPKGQLRYYVSATNGSLTWLSVATRTQDIGFFNPCGKKALDKLHIAQLKSKIDYLLKKKSYSIEEAVEYYCLLKSALGIPLSPNREEFKESESIGNVASITRMEVDSRGNRIGEEETFLLKKTQGSWKVVYFSDESGIDKRKLGKLNITANTAKRLGWSIND